MSSNNLNNTNRAKVPPENEGSTAMNWVIVLAMALAFLLWGLFIFFVVGVSWPPPWRYGTIVDVPGQSIYSVRGASKQAGTAPLEEGEKIRQQHVMGQSGKTEKPRSPGGL
ncbi:MAG: hypothetical protein WA974_04125 [Thermodesulfobacteriota bacterium]